MTGPPNNRDRYPEPMRPACAAEWLIREDMTTNEKGRRNPAPIAAIDDMTSVAGVEYRVQWRRVDWSPTSETKTRRFSRELDARRFVAKLADHRARNLSRAIVTVSCRPVGAWREGWPR